MNLILRKARGIHSSSRRFTGIWSRREKSSTRPAQFRTDIEIDEIEVPENVRLIIGRRLERFNENEKRVLAAAAVIGRSFSFRLLTEVSQVDVDELFTVIEKAQQMGVIVPSSEGPENPFIFAHELVRQTLLAGISAPRRQQLHAAVADAIEQVYPRFVHERAGEIADHLLKAGTFADGRKLVRYLTWPARMHSRPPHSRKRGAAFGLPCRIKAHLTEGKGRAVGEPCDDRAES